MINFGEFAPDVADYNVEVSTVATNCIAGPNGYQPIKELANITDATGGTVINKVKSGHHRTIDDVEYYIIATEDASDVPQFFVNGDEFHQASLVSVPSTNANNYVVFVDWEDELLIFGSVTVPQVIDEAGLANGGITKTSDLGGSPPAAATAARVRSQVVIGNTYESATHHPNRVQWSGFDRNNQWAAGTNQSGFKDLPDTGRIKRIFGGEFGIIFQANVITRINYVGVPSVWEFDPIQEDGIGLFGSKAAAQVGSDIYFLGNDGFYVLKDGTNVVPIGANKVDKWFFENHGNDSGAATPESYAENMVCEYDDNAGTVWWLFADRTTQVSFIGLIYNIKTQRWSTYSHTFISGGVNLARGPKVVFNDSDGFRRIERQSLLVLTNVSGTVRFQNFTGDAEAATIETGHIFDENLKTTIDSVRPIIDGTSTVTILTKQDELSDTEVETAATATDSSGKADFRTNGRYHRIRLTTSGDYLQASGVIVKQHQTSAR